MRLSARAYVELETALRDAFVVRRDYERLARRMGWMLGDIVSSDARLPDIVQGLIERSEAEDALRPLIDSAKALSTNALLAAIRPETLEQDTAGGSRTSYPAEPLAVAQDVAEALREHDVDRLLRTATPDIARELADFISERPSLWWLEWQEWADEIVEVRYEYDRRAYARCGNREDGSGRFYVMELTMVGDAWYCTDMHYCPRDSWNDYFAEQPHGPTVLEVLRSLQGDASAVRPALATILQAFDPSGEVEPNSFDGTLDPQPIIIDGAFGEGENSCVLSYAEAVALAEGQSTSVDFDNDYKPLTCGGLRTAIYWIDPSNHDEVPWIQEKGEWHDPSLEPKLRNALSPVYVIIYRLISPQDARFLRREYYNPGLVVQMDGVIARLDSTLVIGTYRVDGAELDSDSLYRRMGELLVDAISDATGGQCHFRRRKPS